MNMVVTTPLTAGKAYVVDWDEGSDAGWTPDPESCDLDGKTEGVDYIELDYVKTMEFGTNIKIDVMDVAGGLGIATGIEVRHDAVRIMLIEPTRAIMKKIMKFIIGHSDTTADNQTYLIIKHGTDDYETFFDQDRTEQEYLMGWFDNDIKRTFETADHYYNVMLTFRGAWS